MSGKLYLLPMLIAESRPDAVIPQQVQEITTSLRYFFAENIKTTRRYLRKLDQTFDIDGSHFYILNKKSTIEEHVQMLSILLDGNDAGIISEAGLPGIGDPGSKLVSMAHKKNIQVVPLTGPSSFVLALVASGLNGQSFAFHGYLPVKQPELQKTLHTLEKHSANMGQTQIFMETPYRNNQMMQQLLSTCNAQTRLCVAVNISSSNEKIQTLTIQEWKKRQFDFHKQPAVFALLKEN